MTVIEFSAGYYWNGGQLNRQLNQWKWVLNEDYRTWSDCMLLLVLSFHTYIYLFDNRGQSVHFESITLIFCFGIFQRNLKLFIPNPYGLMGKHKSTNSFIYKTNNHNFLMHFQAHRQSLILIRIKGAKIHKRIQCNGYYVCVLHKCVQYHNVDNVWHFYDSVMLWSCDFILKFFKVPLKHLHKWMN